MADTNLCFVVCDGCGPAGLFQQLKVRLRATRSLSQSIEVKQAPCLMACRFGQVVKVLDGEGHIVNSYSSSTRNGFRALSDDPVQQLIDDHLQSPAEPPAELVGSTPEPRPARRNRSR